MTDISKCSGEGCPLKATCRRYTAPAGLVQSWLVAAWDGTACELYLKEKSGG